MKIVTLLFFGVLTMAAHASNRTEYGSVVVNDVRTVYDGDTFKVTIRDWPPIIGDKISVRILGIDTPELRAKCEAEKILARKAKQFTVEKLSAASKVELLNLKRGKYFRILANVKVDGKDLGSQLTQAGLAVPYDGGSKKNWCE